MRALCAIWQAAIGHVTCTMLYALVKVYVIVPIRQCFDCCHGNHCV